MKLKTIFTLEFRYQIRRAATWLYFGVLLALAYLIVIGNYLSDARDGYFLLNAPIVMATVTAICSVKWLLVGASVAGDAATRDVQIRMHLLTYTAPVSKATYLAGRFLAALAINVLMQLAIPLGLLLAMQFSGVEAGILGPFRVAAYVTTFCFIALPNALFGTAIQFTVAVLSRRAMGSYLAGGLLFVGAYLAWVTLPEKGAVSELVDPMSFGPILDHLENDWTPLEKNTRLLWLEGNFLVNRLLWLGISACILMLAYHRFRFTLPKTTPKQNPPETQSAVLAPTGTLAYHAMSPHFSTNFGVATQLRQLRAMTWRFFLQLARSKSGIPLLAVLVLIVGLALPGNLKGRGVPLLPRTDFVLNVLTAPLNEPDTFWMIIALLTIFYAGELVWREREAGLSEIANTAPVREWVLFLSRFLALALLLLAWLVLLMMTGMLTQKTLGASKIDMGLYLQILFGFQWVECVLFGLLALALHVLVNHKFVGHLIALVAYGCVVFAGNLGIEHKLLIYAASPVWTYTDMAGFAGTRQPWLWFKAYWLAWAVLLAIVAISCWVRGREEGFLFRLKLALRRFARLRVITCIAVAGMMLSGGFVFYQTNVLHPYSSASDQKAQRAAYEKHFARYMNIPQPVLKGVKLEVEIHPEQHFVNILGTYLLINNTKVPINAIHLATQPGVETASIHFNKPFRQQLADEEFGYHIYALEKSLHPGDSLKLSFQVRHKAEGFSNDGADPQILANGTSFRNTDWLPAIGYQPYRELDQPGDRKAFGLAPRPATPSLYDVKARHYAPFPQQISFEAIVGTSANQTAVAPGTLRKSWKKGNRSYLHYVADAPIRNEYAIFSANYAVQQEKWTSQSGKEVGIQIFHPRGAGDNAGRMLESAKASVDYYSRHFGTYPHRQLRFVAHPGYAFGNHAAPIDITTEEGFFLLNPKADPRGLDLVTAVVAHEVAHQWWGNMLKAAHVEGAGLITESLAWYSAMCVVEEHYGAEHLRHLLDFLREENENPRSRAALPLLQADDWYQMYRKGPLALYTISQYAGKDSVNSALRKLLAKHRPGTTPLPTSMDLFQELQAATPDSLQALLHDLFKANTFWDLQMENAAARPTKNGKWEVTLRVKADKLTSDSVGRETKTRLNDRIEIGLYAQAQSGQEYGRQLYLQKHLIKSGRQEIRLTLSEKPAKAGFDPRFLLVDWNTIDNVKAVRAAE